MTVEPVPPPRDWHDALVALPEAAAPPDGWARLCVALDAADAADGADASRRASGAGAANDADPARPSNGGRASPRRRLLPLALAATLALLVPVLALRVAGDAAPAAPASTAAIPASAHVVPADRGSSGPRHAMRPGTGSATSEAHKAGRSTVRVDPRPAADNRPGATVEPATERLAASAPVSTRPGHAHPGRAATSPRRTSVRGIASAVAVERRDATAARPSSASSPTHPAPRTAADEGAAPASEPRRLADVAPHEASPPPAVDPLQPLYAEAAQLEALLALTRDDRVASASGAALGDALEDRIASIDFALAQPGLSHAERTRLWRDRVAGLRQLAGVESTERWLALHGRAYGDAFVRVD